MNCWRKVLTSQPASQPDRQTDGLHVSQPTRSTEVCLSSQFKQTNKGHARRIHEEQHGRYLDIPDVNTFVEGSAGDVASVWTESNAVDGFKMTG